MLLHPPIAPWLLRTATGCRVTLLTRDASLDAVYLRTLVDNEESLLPMTSAGEHGAWHSWQADMPWDDGNVATRYAFKVLHGDSQSWLAADGPHPHTPPEALLFRVHRELPPAWVRDQVFYQVFPDRFARAHTPRDRQADTVYGGSRRMPVIQPAWGAPIDPRHAQNTFYGGDIDGVAQQLDHIQHAVGATAVYLNPVFTAGTNHRYDTEDYFNVDPELGGNDALARLAQAMHGRGLKLMLDAVVNHTGTNHPWFNRWGTHPAPGAAQSPASAWRGWYAFDDDGQPVGWKGHASLPVLDFSHPGVRDVVYRGDNAILRHWLRPPYQIDGWRLDVVHMLGEGAGARRNGAHLRGMRQAIKQENAQAFVLGEHFFEATRWLQGDQEDGAMNYYGFAQPVWAWLAGVDVAGHPALLDGAAFDAWLTRARATIPYDNQLAQLNLLGSHDTPRILTRLGGDTALARIALTLLFTYAGAPCIYYGDEVGMAGGADPDCRRCMDWSGHSRNNELLAQVKALSDWRGRRREWREGALMTLAAGADWIVFARYTADAATAIGANRGDAVDIEIPWHRLPLGPLRWVQATGPSAPVQPGSAPTHLPARSAVIWTGDS